MSERMKAKYHLTHVIHSFIHCKINKTLIFITYVYVVNGRGGHAKKRAGKGRKQASRCLVCCECVVSVRKNQ